MNIAHTAGQPVGQELQVELQWNCGDKRLCPADEDICRWARAAVLNTPVDVDSAGEAEVSIRVVDGPEMQEANAEWRRKDKTTNVLSFPADLPAEIGLTHYGDILICAEVVQIESQQQQKTLEAHWAHMVVHGMLHLQGYDHTDDQEAAEMEQFEIRILAGLGFPNPYETGTVTN